MTLKVIHPRNLGKWLDLVKPEGRRQLFSVAANAVRILVRNHLSRIAPRHHISAHRLGATPTGHIEEGALATHFTASPDSAEVIIPIAGLSRAFRPLTITPRNAAALTLPVSPYAYGKRVQLKQDRSLLPSDAELGGTASKAMLDYIRRTTRRSA